MMGGGSDEMYSSSFVCFFLFFRCALLAVT